MSDELLTSTIPADLKLEHTKDEIFQTPGDFPQPFAFNHQVAEVFDDMLVRSIPLYKEMHHLLLAWAHRFYQSGTTLYDLGCSTGTTIEFLHRNKHLLDHSESGLHLAGIDSSQAMIDKAKQKFDKSDLESTIQLICSDFDQAKLSPSSFVVLNYVLQFVTVTKREQLLKKIYDFMVDDGVLFLSEKITHFTPRMKETSIGIYESFKKRNGYSKLEVARKREALIGVLVPHSLDQMITMLKNVGFKEVEPVLLWNSFVSIVAIK